MPTNNFGDFLSGEQREALAEIAQRHKASQQKFTKALGVLWNAQLDLAVASQSSSLLREVMARPLNFADDCNCCSDIVIVFLPRSAQS
ncbi:hypothetical protein [Bradyrhizobium lablabi]|uniref:hypothetical protein n=1 Tax=Bradyrhizobium lablabi TaxID=722472 RepID=UPI001BAD36AF|nr:hypothetical protein [Bradyrhizobium lablabi]MBR0696586.1 hypothetical protein [Bradyrhizobium lablabi]